MKAIIPALALALAAAPASAATIAPNDAGDHIGESVTVEGTVTGVFTDRLSGVTFIDFGGTYPGNAFTAIIFASDAAAFSGVQDLTGRTVDVTGPIRLYHQKPEIILHSGAQLEAR